MEKNKIIEIVKNVEKKSNSDLDKTMLFLEEEFKKTKELILSLTTHLDMVADSYSKIKNELENRMKL